MNGCRVIAWWFLYYTAFAILNVAGPFANQQSCDMVRHERDARSMHGMGSLPCFQDSK